MRPLVVLVEFLVKPGFAKRFGELIAANAKASLENESGCRRFDVLVDPSEPRRYVLYEIYDDEEAFDAHLRSTHFKSFAEAVENEIENRSLRRLGFCSEMATSDESG